VTFISCRAEAPPRPRVRWESDLLALALLCHNQNNYGEEHDSYCKDRNRGARFRGLFGRLPRWPGLGDLKQTVNQKNFHYPVAKGGELALTAARLDKKLTN